MYGVVFLCTKPKCYHFTVVSEKLLMVLYCVSFHLDLILLSRYHRLEITNPVEVKLNINIPKHSHFKEH